MQKLIQTAKYNIENHYSVVGITHHMKFTFLLFEYYLPRFFNNAMTLYEDLEIEHSKKIYDNKNPYRWLQKNYELVPKFCYILIFFHFRPQLTSKRKFQLMKHPLMTSDLEVYSFVLQRFHEQLNKIVATTEIEDIQVSGLK